METHTFYVVFLACHFVWLSDCLLPYGTNERNEHLSKRGPDTDRGLYGEGRSRTSNSRSCSDSFDTRNNYIIRTQESLDNDATFIDALKVETAEACMERCCDANDVIDDDGTKVMCDASVFVDGDYAFENKESNCFIFQCRFDEGERFRCKFSDHDSYISSMVGGFGEEPYFEEDEEEEEEEIPQTKQATTTTQDEWKTNAKEPANTEAVEECNENQFQCDNGECIRLTLLCDDYDDCQDKSDESEQCDTIEDGNATPHNGSLWKIWKYMYGSSAQDYATEYPPNGEDDNEVEEGETGAEVDDENDVGDVEVPNEEVNDLEPDDNLPEKNDTSPPGQGNSDTTMKPIQTHQSSLSSSSSEDKITPGKTTNNSDAKEVVNHVSQPSMVHIADKQSVTATAVLPLTIGLFLTMFLLLMMSCRLRYMNRRLRYGRLKTNNVHDADYLINGMYL